MFKQADNYIKIFFSTSKLYSFIIFEELKTSLTALVRIFEFEVLYFDFVNNYDVKS